MRKKLLRHLRLGKTLDGEIIILTYLRAQRDSSDLTMLLI